MADMLHVMEIPIEPKSRQGHEELHAALASLTASGGPVTFGTDLESGQTILKGESEDALVEFVGRLNAIFEMGVNFGAPKVAYRETLSRTQTILYTHKRQTGGAGQFAGVTIEFAPLLPGSGFVFEERIGRGGIPEELIEVFIPAVEKGIRIQKESGLLAGFPVIDFMARLIDVKFHEVDSNALTFEIAARAAFRDRATKGVAILLEPIMNIEVVTPEEFLGPVIGDLNRRRGSVQSLESGEGLSTIVALTPLSNLFGYSDTLRALTEGRATRKMRFSHYEKVPQYHPDDDPRFPGAAAMRVA